MSKYLSLTLFSWFLVSGLAFGIPKAENRCGGEGPHPLIDITSLFEGKATLIPSVTDVKEFLLWDMSKLLLYRNTENDVYLTNEAGDSTPVAASMYPIAPVVDPQERFFATQSGTWVFDAAYRQWYHYNVEQGPVDPIFFHKNYLYGLNSKIDMDGKQLITIYQYLIGGSTKVACRISAKPGDTLQIARGHSFPYVFFYQTKGSLSNPIFSLYSADVTRKCRLFGFTQYTRPISGPVRSVHYLQEADALAIEVDHPTLNLLWHSPSGCRYYNIGTRRPYVPNYRKPIVATWSVDEGIRFIYLDKDDDNGYTADVNQFLSEISELPISDITQKDIWLSNDEKNFYLSPKFKDRGKVMIKLNLTTNRLNQAHLKAAPIF